MTPHHSCNRCTAPYYPLTSLLAAFVADSMTLITLVQCKCNVHILNRDNMDAPVLILGWFKTHLIQHNRYSSHVSFILVNQYYPHKSQLAATSDDRSDHHAVHVLHVDNWVITTTHWMWHYQARVKNYVSSYTYIITLRS